MGMFKKKKGSVFITSLIFFLIAGALGRWNAHRVFSTIVSILCVILSIKMLIDNHRTIMPALALIILVGGAVRLYQLCRNPKFDQPYSIRSPHHPSHSRLSLSYPDKIHYFKIACCALLALAHLVSIISRVALNLGLWFQLAADIRDFVCWVTFFIIFLFFIIY